MFEGGLGSENNSVCVYYGGLSKLLLSHKFSSVKHLLVRRANYSPAF